MRGVLFADTSYIVSKVHSIDAKCIYERCHDRKGQQNCQMILLDPIMEIVLNFKLRNVQN